MMRVAFWSHVAALLGLSVRRKGTFVGRRRTHDTARRTKHPAKPCPPQLEQYLKKRGFTPAKAEPLCFEAFESQAEVEAKLPLLRPARPGFTIPYFDIAGKQIDFYRFRYFGEVLLRNKKQLRYMQEAGSKVHAYFPPLVDWQKIVRDVKHPIGITEGEMKAALATLHGLPFVGLGGVWNFRSKKEVCSLIPELSEESIRWKDRVVNICFDSDIDDNEQVAAAQNALARQLTNLGALVKVCFLKRLGEEKTGLDDFIVARGIEVFQNEILDRADDWSTSKALHQLNEEVIFIETPPTGIVVRRRDSMVMDFRRFRDAMYANWSHDVIVDKKLKQKSTATEWLKWLPRATASCITYEPGAPRMTEANEWNIWPGWGCEPKRGDVKPFHALFDHLATGLTANEKKWLLQWFAYPLQHPGVKLHTAVVLWGYEQGTGKSLVGYTMMKIYGENAKEIEERDLQKNFNSWAAKRQFIVGDEIAGGEKRGTADRMKGIITRPNVTINEKQVPEYTIPDCINYYFTSNHPDSFFIEDSDRRYFVHAVSVKPLPEAFYAEYRKWFDGDGPAALFHYLLELDTSSFNPDAHAPSTAAKKAMIETGRSALESFIASLPENSELGIRKLWTAKQLVPLFNKNPNDPPTLEKAIGRLLGRYYKQWGRRGGDKRGMPVKEINARLWIVSRDESEIKRLNAMAEAEIVMYYKQELKSEQKKAKF